MSAVVRFHHPGPPSVLVLEDEDVPLPGSGEVRFRARAIGVNFVDTAFRDGSFNTALPAVGGVEAAGVIEAVGPGVAEYEVGDRVGYFFAPGSYAELRNVPAEVLIRLPDDIAFDDAAIMTKGLTAWVAIRHLHPVEPGEAVLVQGASEGVGSLTARWADALGTRVVGTGSAAKLGVLDGRASRVSTPMIRVWPTGCVIWSRTASTWSANSWAAPPSRPPWRRSATAARSS